MTATKSTTEISATKKLLTIIAFKVLEISVPAIHQARCSAAFNSSGIHIEPKKLKEVI